MKFVVYTAIAGGYDTLKPPPELWRREASFVAFLEKPQNVPGWEIRPVYQRFCDPCRNAKIHKILSHHYFPEADYTLWIDGSVLIRSALLPSHWPAEFLSQHDLAVFAHRNRNCIYREGAACLRLGLDASETINRQMQKYFEEGYPPDHGLAECTVLFRRNTDQIRRFNEAWYAEIQAQSRRDQLSFNYVARKLGMQYGLLPGKIDQNAHFHVTAHRQAAFDARKHPGFDPPDVVIVSYPRSGTHFLESCLASHPRIHKRSECVLRYKLGQGQGQSNEKGRQPTIFRNRPNQVNVAIVMYFEIGLFEQLCGSIFRYKTIHLLRDPKATARSVLQWEANKAQYGKQVRAHYRQNEKPPPNAKPTKDKVDQLVVQVERFQKKFRTKLARHPNLLELHYEELTGDTQINRLPDTISRQVLEFIGLDFQPLTTTLKKTSAAP